MSSGCTCGQMGIAAAQRMKISYCSAMLLSGNALDLAVQHLLDAESVTMMTPLMSA